MHQHSAIIAPGDNSMRCTLRRGRPNTPKTGLSVDYRIRKSSVPNTPECTNVKNLVSNKINHTISSNDDIRVKLGSVDIKKGLTKKSKSKTSVVVTLSSSSLNTAMVQDDDEDKMSSAAAPLNTSNPNANDNCNESRLLDMAFNEDDIENEQNTSCHSGSHLSSQSNSSSSASESSETSMLLKKKSKSKNRQLSLSLSNLPQVEKETSLNLNDNNATSVSDNTEVLMKKSNSTDLALTDQKKEETENEKQHLDELETEQKRDNIARKNSINCAPPSSSTEIAVISEFADEEKETSKPLQLEQHKQQNCIQFEPFKFKMPEIIPEDLKNGNLDFFSNKENDKFLTMEENDNMLQNVLRRQSLFKLKEKINGKVSKHICEIEKRKLSPYRFSNSPLKPKKAKENCALLTKMVSLKNQANVDEDCRDQRRASPIRMPSVFCKKILKEQVNSDQYINRSKSTSKKLSTTIATSTTLDTTTTTTTTAAINCEPKLPSDSPLISRAKNQFYKKFSKNRSVKRLNATMSSFATNLSSIADTSLETSKNISQTTANEDLTKMNKSHSNSPTGKHLIISTEWKCSTESIDL